jgi:hypothetical protein
MILLSVLKYKFDFSAAVDWSGRRETPAGAVGRVRPHRSIATRRLTTHPAERECLPRKSTSLFNRIIFNIVYIHLYIN